MLKYKLYFALIINTIIDGYFHLKVEKDNFEKMFYYFKFISAKLPMKRSLFHYELKKLFQQTIVLL